MTVSDILIVPILPATFDIWSLEPLNDLIQEAREINGELRVIAVLNASDAQGRDNDEAAAIIREKTGLEYFPYPIIRLRNAAAAGLSVVECRPADEKAIHEFRLFANHVFGYTGDIVSISYGDRKASCSKDRPQRSPKSGRWWSPKIRPMKSRLIVRSGWLSTDWNKHHVRWCRCPQTLGI